MFDFEVRSAAGKYKVQFVQSFAEGLKRQLRPGDVVLLDEAVEDRVTTAVGTWPEHCSVIRLKATEEQKSYRGVEGVIGTLLDVGFKKKGRLAAIGGGVSQDVTGFVASILFRGVEWWFVPTTLLAQCDSCIGSKTSINFGPFKNQLGNFCPPAQVLIDFTFLQSLSEREIRSGLGEMAHYYFLSNADDFDTFETAVPTALCDTAKLGSLIKRSLQIKRRFIEADEFDRRERQLLNYGHSFGHALESVTGYSLAHGIAVSYGMDIANHVSHRMGLLNAEQRDRMRAVLRRIWEPYPLPPISVDALIGALWHDKKNVGTKLGLILTEGIGRMRKDFVEVTPDFERILADYFAD